jgi:hypothetical protein
MRLSPMQVRDILDIETLKFEPVVVVTVERDSVELLIRC